MSVSKIYMKTMKFVWLRLGIGMVITLISLLLLAAFLGIGSLFESSGMLVGFILWLISTVGVYQLVMRYVGYMIKAAHIAVITKAVVDKEIPDDMVNYGKEMVKERFGTTNIYFVVDQLVSGSVKQIQNTVGKLDSLLGNIPGVSAIIGIVQLFIGIALGYIDECCLGYTFINSNQGACKSACDGVCIYFQNIKHFLKKAVGTTAMVVAATFLAWLGSYAIIGILFSLFNLSNIFAVLGALLVALVIKNALIDSYMLVKTMATYMEIAPSCEVTYDLYGKLCKLSGKFKKLWDKSEEEERAAAI